MKNKYHR